MISYEVYTWSLVSLTISVAIVGRLVFVLDAAWIKMQGASLKDVCRILTVKDVKDDASPCCT